MFEKPVTSGHFFSFGAKVAARTLRCTASSAGQMLGLKK